MADLIDKPANITALALFSGGLDSILACRVIADQGIRVKAVKFVTPFFGYELLQDPEQFTRETKDSYGIDAVLEDISPDYLNLLHNPSHGFGKNFNPCIDCKILMLKAAKKLMSHYNASFLITGEVLGQRPMSQRRDTLRVIERDSETDAYLLRPLSARMMKPTLAEEQGLVDREKLLDFTGRGRSRQIALAKEYGISDYPAPAGGCILADPILSRRISRIYNGDLIIKPQDITTTDVRLLLVGRQFLLPGGGWLVLGRDEKENDRLEEMAGIDDAVMFMPEWPGPTAVLRYAGTCYADQQSLDRELQIAAGLVVRYGKKRAADNPTGSVSLTLGEDKSRLLATSLADDVFKPWFL